MVWGGVARAKGERLLGQTGRWTAGRRQGSSTRGQQGLTHLVCVGSVGLHGLPQQLHFLVLLRGAG